jgi:DNA-directed RNA polymerase specialized sigma24 family protein
MLAACEMAIGFRPDPGGGGPDAGRAAYLEWKLRAAAERVRASTRPAGYRSHRHRTRGAAIPATGPLETPAGRVDVPAPPGPDVAAAEWAEALLRRLAAGPREAVRLTVLEGLTRDAAAARMGRSRRGVSLLRAAGLARLRAILAAGGDPR